MSLAAIWASTPAMLTAFLTGSILAALSPMLLAAESLVTPQDVASNAASDGEGECSPYESLTNMGEAETSTIVPLALNFPTAGSLLPLLYLLFAASAYDRPLGLATQPKTVLAGILALFGSSVTALSIMFAMAGIPAEATALYIGLSVLLDRLKAMLGSVSVLCLVALIHSGLKRQIRVPALLPFVMVGVLLGVGMAARLAGTALKSPSAIQGAWRCRRTAWWPWHVRSALRSRRGRGEGSGRGCMGAGPNSTHFWGESGVGAAAATSCACAPVR